MLLSLISQGTTNQTAIETSRKHLARRVCVVESRRWPPARLEAALKITGHRWSSLGRSRRGTHLGKGKKIGGTTEFRRTSVHAPTGFGNLRFSEDRRRFLWNNDVRKGRPRPRSTNPRPKSLRIVAINRLRVRLLFVLPITSKSLYLNATRGWCDIESKGTMARAVYFAYFFFFFSFSF